MPRPGWSPSVRRGGGRRAVGSAKLPRLDGPWLAWRAALGLARYEGTRQRLMRAARNGDKGAQRILWIQWRVRLLVKE